MLVIDPSKLEKPKLGYDLAGESVNLFLAHEISTYAGIDRRNKEIDRLVTKMESLEEFLGFVANRTADSKRLDLDTAEDQQRVDNLRSHDDLRHIFPEGKYAWKETEIENLSRMLNQHIEGPLQRNINMETEKMVLDQHELTKALDIFKSGLTRMTNLIERILSNVQRSH